MRLPSQTITFDAERQKLQRDIAAGAVVQCSACRVAVPTAQVHTPQRCMDPNCPLKPQEVADGRPV